MTLTLPNENKWMYDFVRDLLTENGKRSWKRWIYSDEYLLDIEELETLAKSDRHIPDKAEFQQQTIMMTPAQVKEYADYIAERYHENQWGMRVQMFLQMLDKNFAETLKTLNDALAVAVVDVNDDQYEDFHFPEFKVVNANRYSVPINAVTPEHNGNVVQLVGTLVYLSDPPEMEYTNRVYQCNSCSSVFESPEATKKCFDCGKESVEFLEDDPNTVGRNFQKAVLQENVEDLARSAATINIKFYDGLINQFTPGDRVRVTGTITLEKIPKQNSYYYWLNVISCTNLDDDIVKVTENDLKEIEEFRKKNPDPLQALAEMFVPGIVGYMEVKKAMILQAASGVELDYSDRKERGRIHILLAGDPGKAKSQFLMACKTIQERSFYISDTSKAGLTVAVSIVGTKKALVPGIMVLANNGTACIDELDKMQKEDREGLHTAMEQGTISKSKAGMRGIFKANTSVLAAANPEYGRFDLERNIPEQLKIEASLLDRFDLIFWFIDRPQTRDELMQMAMKVLMPKQNNEKSDFLKKYIKIASYYKPELTVRSAEAISETFANLKEASANSASIGMRTMHAIRRLSEASAKIRFSNVVEEIDIENAKSLIIEAIKPIGYDLDRLSGTGSSMRAIIDQIRTMMKTLGTSVKVSDLIHNLEGLGIKSLDIVEAIESMKKTGDLYEPSYGTLQLV